MSTPVNTLPVKTALGGAELIAIEDAGTAKSTTSGAILADATGHAAAHASMGFYVGSMSFATLLASFPPATTAVGATATITEFGGILMRNTGTYWRPSNKTACLLMQTADITTVANTSEQIFTAEQITFPAGFLQVGCKLRDASTFSKSGTSETSTLRWRLGTAGTTADTTINSSASFTATTIGGGSLQEFQIKSATTIQRMGGAANTVNSFAFGASLPASPVTISNISNALILSLSSQMNTGAETMTSYGRSLEVIFP